MKWIKINSEEDFPPDGKNIYIYAKNKHYKEKRYFLGWYNKNFHEHVWYLSEKTWKEQESEHLFRELGFVELIIKKLKHNNIGRSYSEELFYKILEIDQLCDWVVTHWMLPEPPEEE